MPLSHEQIKKLVETRPCREQIQKAINHENRLKFHTETILEKTDLGPAWIDFTNWISSEKPILLEAGKVDRIKQLIRTPIATVELSESIYSRLNRVFYSQDAFFEYNFNDPKLDKDWQEYRDNTFWADKGFEAMQTAINSVWVSWLPFEQKGDKPEPTNRLIDINDVIDISVDSDNNCQWVIFERGSYLYAYDSEFIRVFNYEESVLKDLVIEIPHGLGYTPARMFWNKRLRKEDHLNKECPITKELSDFDWLLFHMASKRYLDIANAYPILITYDLEGGYDDDSQTDNAQQPRTKPEGGSDLGMGTHWKIDPPEEGQPDMMSNPARYLNPDVNTLDWHVKEELRLVQKIFKSVVGTDQENRNDAAKNEMQIEGSYESQTSVLLRIKANFEIIQKFADSTICKLRYGDSFEDCTIDYGTKFFLKTVEDLHVDYKQAKESGANDVVLDEITTTILDTKFRDNKSGRSRAMIIRDLDPMPEKSMDEVIKVFDKGGIDKTAFIIKSNLLNFVRRFEREEGNLIQFGQNITYRAKLESINKAFKIYANENSELQTQGE